MTEYNGFQLGKRSRSNLEGVHPALVSVVELAIQRTECDFTVIDGLRTIEEQQILYERGKSQTLKSRHLTGHAVDLGAHVGGRIVWDWDYYHQIAEAMKAAANDLNVTLEWGGDWETFKDGPHFQLSKSRYPASGDWMTEVPEVRQPFVRIKAAREVEAPKPVAKKSRWTRYAGIAAAVVGATGLSSATPVVQAVLPLIDQIASGVGVKDVVIGGLAGFFADRFAKDKA